MAVVSWTGNAYAAAVAGPAVQSRGRSRRWLSCWRKGHCIGQQLQDWVRERRKDGVHLQGALHLRQPIILQAGMRWAGQ